MATRSDTTEKDWDAISIVTSSRYREAVVERLATSPATPSTIAADQDVSIASVSHALSRLSDEGFVELLVDEDVRKGRYYGLTERGDEIAQQLEEVA